MAQFREGKYNVMVATSIGEEGLDIGSVDAIFNYDAPKSSIRVVGLPPKSFRMSTDSLCRCNALVEHLVRDRERSMYFPLKVEKSSMCVICRCAAHH